MTHHEHHFRSLQRSRDGLTNTIVSLQSAAGRMTGDDWIDAVALLELLETNVGPRLARLRERASARFDEWSTRSDFDAMRAGLQDFPDERAVGSEVPPLQREPPFAGGAEARPRLPDVPAGGGLRRPAFPNSLEGARLVELHGGVDAAERAYQPDSLEFDHIQAYRYASTGKRPPGWIPPVV